MKLATKCTFKFNSRVLKQVDGCTIGGQLFVTFSEIYMVKMENDFAIPLNNYHPNIKLTIEIKPSKFLDTKLTNINGAYIFNTYHKDTKLPSPWTSKILK